MREVKDWTTYYMDLAHSVAERSKDPKTQVGAVVVDAHNDVVATGYNGFAEGVEETAEMWERPHKYPRVIHAEMNAIGRAARTGKAIGGGTLYVTAFPCLPCAKMIVACGLKKVVAARLLHGWDDDHGEAARRFDESGIEWTVLDYDPLGITSAQEEMIDEAVSRMAHHMDPSSRNTHFVYHWEDERHVIEVDPLTFETGGDTLHAYLKEKLIERHIKGE